MWFLSANKTRRTPRSSSARQMFRPRLEALEDRCLLSTGALDPTFGNGGTVIGPLNGRVRVVVQPADGKIVVGGYVTTGNFPGNSSNNFALARYNPDGSLDNNFGHNGVVSTAVGKGDSPILGLALQSDGAI